ncbi:MAG TPA: response regulator [Deltaproteobacteria bacterium]|nr:response regulator [Deltaproteobacteria bacterium]
MKTILVVDDSSVARKIVIRCLKIVGHSEAEFPEAGHGQEALDILREREVDLVVTDLNMPVMDGVTLVRKLKASPRFQHIPVVVVSSLLNEAAREKLRERGVDLMVEKPLSPAGLSAVLGGIEGGIPE